MNRPTRAQTLMTVAEAFAARGTCDRKQVGAVIAIEGRIIACGYNGAPPGIPHCEETEHGWAPLAHDAVKSSLGVSGESDRNLWTGQQLIFYGCRNATHAEANALAFAARHGVPTDGADLYVTVSPCDNCARLLIAAGIRRVWFLEAYRDESGVNLLQQAGVKAVPMPTVVDEVL